MYISIKNLKKEAKYLRKNNNTIKNHADSLDLIAVKYGHKNWQDLLTHSYLLYKIPENKPIEKSLVDIDELKEKAIQSFIHTYNLFFNVISNEDSFSIATYMGYIIELSDRKNEIKENNLNDYYWRSRSNHLLMALAEVYSRHPVRSFELFKKVFYQSPASLFNMTEALRMSDSPSIQKLKEMIMLEEFIPHQTILSDEQRNQYGYLSMFMTAPLTFIDCLYTNFKKESITREDVLQLCAKKNNDGIDADFNHLSFCCNLTNTYATQEIKEYASYVKYSQIQ